MSSIGTKIGGLIALAAAGAALSLAAPAQAGNLTLISSTMNTSYTAQITGPAAPFTGGGLDVYEGPITFTVSDGSHAGNYQITAFCVDLFDEIGLGAFNPNLKYTTESLTTTRDTDGQHLGSPLSGSQLSQINGLLTLASGLEGVSSNAANLAAIQGAIWKVENPGYAVTSHSVLDLLTTGYFNQAISGVLPTSGQTTIISAYDPNGNYHQAFAFAVPEPATWAMMIIGFGGVGAVMRKRRTATAFA